MPDALVEVPVPVLPPERFRGTPEPAQEAAFFEATGRARELFSGRVVWNVNSTARGGGVAEMLQTLLGYVRGAGVDTRWVVIKGNPTFFAVTKRIHNHLHGAAGDAEELDASARDSYESTLAGDAGALAAMVRAEDVVILHDPQTAGLVDAVRAIGARVVWRCHVGVDTPNQLVRDAWRFLGGYVGAADAIVFSHRAFVWDNLDAARVHIIAPSIDVFAPKNADLDAEQVRALLGAAGITTDHSGRKPAFRRADGSPGRIDVPASMVGGAIPHDARLVTQVSRWDRLKDPAGVLDGFVEHVLPGHPDVHLALAGPEVSAVDDDPEGAGVLAEITARHQRLARGARAHVHLVALPMADRDANAWLVNAMQRHASIVVQKSLAEGFGLTVAEAMWKGRPVVASRVGGIQDQIDDGVNGLLIDDPHDLAAFGAAVNRLLDDPASAAAMGRSAHDSVRRDYLGSRHLLQYVELLTSL